ncbi:MAG: carbon-nitrogen hydrolase family protein [Truepera sp.]|nr:carbon-nitrogen hydrolase family protein [Truepera sp.]
MPSATLKVGLAQIAPVWLDRERTLAKVITWCERAAAKGCALVAFGEALLPGYPFWLERTDGARFNAPDQKALFARYLDQAVAPEAGHLDPLREVAAERGLMVVLGTVERAADRGGHSLYCTLMIIGADGALLSAHRKLVPTYEERLVWSTGDGHGLQTHRLDPFTVGALNCWENWMPLPRAALYGLGEDLHVALWPGALRNTCDITRYLALEGRSYVLSVSGLLRPEDIPEDIPERGRILAGGEPFLADGGSCLAGPDGSWVLEPLVAEEALRVAEIDHGRVLEERQNFDPAGHYSRPDVTRLVLDRRRQRTVEDA